MKKFGLRVLCMFVMICLGTSQVYAQAIPIPFRIGGTVTIDGVQVTQATDDGLAIRVVKQDGSDFADFKNKSPEAGGGLNKHNWYIIDVPSFNSSKQPGGASAGNTAVINVFVNLSFAIHHRF